jgi:hypothetical protein
MEKRLQKIADDIVLEITENAPIKTRLSEKTLLRDKAYYEDAIARFQAELKAVNDKLALIYAEKGTT